MNEWSSQSMEVLKYRTEQTFRYLIVGIRYFSVFQIPTSVSVSFLFLQMSDIGSVPYFRYTDPWRILTIRFSFEPTSNHSRIVFVKCITGQHKLDGRIYRKSLNQASLIKLKRQFVCSRIPVCCNCNSGIMMMTMNRISTHIKRHKGARGDQSRNSLINATTEN